jgi:predicted histidine transporter YuiF (NhaC family)
MTDLITTNNRGEGDENDKEKEEARIRRLILIAVIVFIMIAVILTFGWFYFQKEKEKEEIRRQEEERRRQEEKEKKLRRLAEIEARIQELQAIKEKLKKTEKRIIIGIRIGIGVILVIVNCLYKYYKIYPFDFESDIGKLLNLNATILTAYSFFAFITFGTINNFVKRMKAILGQQLRRKHIDSLSELDALIAEKIIIIKDLETM